MGLAISRLVRSNSLSGREAAGLDELQHLTLSELEEGAASAEQTAAALPSLSIWERRHRVSEIFTRAPHQPGSTAAERAVKARLWNLMGVLCLVGLIGTTTTGTVRIVLSGNRTRRSGALCRAPRSALCTNARAHCSKIPSSHHHRHASYEHLRHRHHQL